MHMFRRLAERASRNLVFRRKLPPDFGGRSIFVSPHAALRFWIPDSESMDPLLFKMVRQWVKPGAIVWDVGANVGLFSFAAAALAGRSGSVLAIEPDPWLASLLIRTASEPSTDAAVLVLSVAISDQVGVSALHIAKRGRASNFVSNAGCGEAGGERCSFPVLTVTLDWLSQFFPMPTIIKIDVEGMEHLALAGGSAVLRNRPVIIAEVAEGNRAAVQACLRGYRFLMTDMQPARNVPNNLIALPE